MQWYKKASPLNYPYDEYYGYEDNYQEFESRLINFKEQTIKDAENGNFKDLSRDQVEWLSKKNPAIIKKMFIKIIWSNEDYNYISFLGYFLTPDAIAKDPEVYNNILEKIKRDGILSFGLKNVLYSQIAIKFSQQNDIKYNLLKAAAEWMQKYLKSYEYGSKDKDAIDKFCVRNGMVLARLWMCQLPRYDLEEYVKNTTFRDMFNYTVLKQDERKLKKTDSIPTINQLNSYLDEAFVLGLKSEDIEKDIIHTLMTSMAMTLDSSKVKLNFTPNDYELILKQRKSYKMFLDLLDGSKNSLEEYHIEYIEKYLESHNRYPLDYYNDNIALALVKGLNLAQNKIKLSPKGKSIPRIQAARLKQIMSMLKEG